MCVSTCVCACVSVSRMQEPVNTGRSLGAPFPLGSSPGRKPDLVCFSRKLDVPPKKAQWSFLEKTTCCWDHRDRSRGKSRTQKLAQAGLGTRVSTGHGLHCVAIEVLQLGAVTRTEGALSPQSGSRSKCGTNSMPPSAPVTPGFPRDLHGCRGAHEAQRGTGEARWPKSTQGRAAHGLDPRRVVSMLLPPLNLAADVSGRFCTAGCPLTLMCAPLGKAVSRLRSFSTGGGRDGKNKDQAQWEC